MHIGKNIELKPISGDDWLLLHEWFNQPEFWGDFREIWCYSVDDVKNLANMKDGNSYMIIERTNKKPVGVIGNYPAYVIYPGIEIGYFVHQDHRGKGIATQATSLLINHLFSSTHVEKILANVTVGNVASYKVLERSGMVLEGVERKKDYNRGKYHDKRLYSILREEWVDECTYRAKCPF